MLLLKHNQSIKSKNDNSYYWPMIMNDKKLENGLNLHYIPMLSSASATVEGAYTSL